ncbi:EAL domain-containing protein [Methylocaldum sp. 14B]|uniref:EAL domain-containing protein n=1 Tax=Methylocaldum sp. 14B TaxID=1912213 RepID=UPI00098A9523|nr:EAL domain-containing protein [Methylocaldum sp. 14B]
MKPLNPPSRRIAVESVTLVETACPPRWTGRILFPGERRFTDILIFSRDGQFWAIPAHCPHEGHDLTDCPLFDGGKLICPVHGQRIELNSAALKVEVDNGRFNIPLPEKGPYWICNTDHEPSRGEEDSEALRQMREETEKLRLANLKQEKRILAITRSMDAMLKESEQQKAKLKEAMGRQQALSRFIQRVLDTMDDVLVVVDAEGRIRQVNGAAERQLGLSEEAWSGSPVDELLSPEDRRFLAAQLPPLPWPAKSALLETIRLHKSYSGEHRLSVPPRQRPGPIYWLKGNLLHSEQGKLEGAVITATNITEIKARETQLRLNAKVFENTSEAIFITDLEGTILDVNDAFCDISGYRRSEVVGQSTRLLKSGLQDQAFYVRMWKTLLSKGYWKGEIWDRRKSGECFPMLLTINAVADERDRLTHYVAVALDISSLKHAERKLEQLAYYDSLTGLPNRFLFKERFEHESALALRNGTRLAVCFIDLDNFKDVNDTLGHWAGDYLLKEVASRIRNCLRKTDTVARFGGDEFTIILSNVADAAEPADVAQKLIDTVGKPIHIQNHQIFVGASIGIALFPDDGRDFTTLTKHADAAMYVSKAKGRRTFRYFEDHMKEEPRQRMVMETQLRQAIEREEFLLYYQPKVDCVSNRITGAEALIRWRHPEQGIVSPGRFITIAEETALIIPLGQWILRTACLRTSAWQHKLPEFRIAINLSAKQLLADDFIDLLDRVLAETGTDPGAVELEITETLVMHDIEKASERLSRIRDRGIHIAMDDFGTGYSSLSYLQKLPVQTIKIDRSFIHAYTGDPTSEQAALIKTIVTLGQILNLKVVAEGVETREQLELLKFYGCHEIQGYYVSPPLPEDEFEKRFIEQRDS